MKKFLGLLLVCSFALFSCEEKSSVLVAKSENKIVSDVKQKIDSFKKAPARVEVRNYLKAMDHKYQHDVKLIKKMKVHLDPKSDVYLELNLFTNEQDKNAPLVAQLMWFDIKTKNLILEENLNLEPAP